MIPLNDVLAKDRMMNLTLSHGGHMSHGHQTSMREGSAAWSSYEILTYDVDLKTGLIDYDGLARKANHFKPKLIVAGASAYSRFIDFKKFREICDAAGSILMADISHISGLVAAGLHPSPFPYADVVTTTTHKSLRGPYGAMVFYRYKQGASSETEDLETQDLGKAINASVSPGHQGSSHNNTTIALATALLQAKSELFRQYQHQVLHNARRLAHSLQELGYELLTGGTDNHTVIINLQPQSIGAKFVDWLMSRVNISVNCNAVPGDRDPTNPSGIRLGSFAMTSRGMIGSDFDQVANYLHRCVQLALQTKASLPQTTSFNDFQKEVSIASAKDMTMLRDEIRDWVRPFGIPKAEA